MFRQAIPKQIHHSCVSGESDENLPLYQLCWRPRQWGASDFWFHSIANASQRRAAVPIKSKMTGNQSDASNVLKREEIKDARVG
jgi:hypothetical protein